LHTSNKALETYKLFEAWELTQELQGEYQSFAKGDGGGTSSRRVGAGAGVAAYAPRSLQL
jgi:hypothetical protein